VVTRELCRSVNSGPGNQVDMMGNDIPCQLWKERVQEILDCRQSYVCVSKAVALLVDVISRKLIGITKVSGNWTFKSPKSMFVGDEGV